MPDNTWIELGDGRLCFEHPLGFKIIKPVNTTQTVPLLCDICSGPMLSFEDNCSYFKNSCCELCSLKWVDVYREKWVSGWRPTKEEVIKETERRRKRVKKINL